MKINFNEALTNLDGSEIKGVDGKVFTLRIAACNALSAVFDDEPQLSGEEKARRGLTAMRVYSNPDVDLSVEDIAIIKKLIGKAYAPLIVAKAWGILEK